MRFDKSRHSDSWAMVKFFTDAKAVRRRGRFHNRSVVLDDLVTRTLYTQLMDLLGNDDDDDDDDDDLEFDDI